MGIEIEPHIKTHSYYVKAAITIPLFEPDWGADEELILLDGIEQYGFGNWNDIADMIGNGKNKQKVEQHYNECYIYSKSGVEYMPDTINTLDQPGVVYQRNIVPLSDSEIKYRASLQQQNTYNQFATQAKQNTMQSIDNHTNTLNPSPSPSPTPPITTTTQHSTTSNKTPTPQALNAAGFAVPQTITNSTTTDSLSSQLNTNTTSLATKRRLSKHQSNNRLSGARGSGLVGSQNVKPKSRGKGLLVGWQEKRGDFDTEYENNAELIIADMEFSANDSTRDRMIKLDVLSVYNSILDERAERKRFILERGLLERRERKRSKLERDVYNAYRPFARFHSAEQHEIFVQGILKEQMIRQRIQQLQHYRVMGITTLAEAEMYEVEKRKRDTAINMKYQAKNTFDSTGTNKRSNTGSKRNMMNTDNDPQQSNTQQSTSNKSTLHEAARSMRQHSAGDSTLDDVEYDCSTMEGARELKSTEIELCNLLHLEPKHYLQIKDKICMELHNRDLYKQGTGNKLIRVEINKQSNVLDFMIDAGWINTQHTFNGETVATPYNVDRMNE